MPHSFSQTLQVSCTHCAAAHEVEIWLIVDVAERPDLGRLVEMGHLHRVTCPACGDALHQVAAPLLLFRPDLIRPLFFAAAPGSSTEKAAQDAATLISRLEENLGDGWRRAWFDDLWWMESRSLPDVLRLDREAGEPELHRRVRGLQVRDALLRKLLEAVPYGLLYDQVPQPVEEMATYVAELVVADDDGEEPAPTQESTAQRVAAGSQEWRTRHPERAADVDRMKQRCLLVKGRLDAIHAARDGGEWRRCLELCAEALGDSDDFPPRLRADLLRIQGATLASAGAEDETRFDQAVAILESSLELMSPQHLPMAWAQAQIDLGNAYVRRPPDARGENFERAIAAYERALTVLDRERTPMDWARARVNLGLAIRQRVQGTESENAGRSIAILEPILEFFPPDSALDDWARLQLVLAAEYLRRGGDEVADFQAARTALESIVDTAQPGSSWWLDAGLRLAEIWLRRPDVDREEAARHVVRRLRNVYDVLHGPVQRTAAGATELTPTVQWMLDVLRRSAAVLPRDLDPDLWAHLRNDLGFLLVRFASEPGSDLDEVIACFEDALAAGSWSPIDWAATQWNLAVALRQRGRGRDPDDLEKALAACEQALSVYTPEAAPFEWSVNRLFLVEILFDMEGDGEAARADRRVDVAEDVVSRLSDERHHDQRERAREVLAEALIRRDGTGDAERAVELLDGIFERAAEGSPHHRRRRTLLVRALYQLLPNQAEADRERTTVRLQELDEEGLATLPPRAREELLLRRALDPTGERQGGRQRPAAADGPTAEELLRQVKLGLRGEMDTKRMDALLVALRDQVLGGGELVQFEATYWTGRYFLRLGMIEPAEGFGAQLRELGRRAGHSTILGHGLHLTALAHAQRGDRAAALAGCDEALAAYREADNAEGCARALSTRGHLLSALDRPTEAVEALSEAVSRFREHGDPAALADALATAGGVLFFAGHNERALTVLAEAVALYQDLGEDDRRAAVLAERSRVLLRIGRTRAAVDAAAEAEEVFAALGHDAHRAYALVEKGSALARLGDAHAAVAAADEALALCEQPHASATAGNALLLKGQIIASLGRFEGALEALTEAAEIYGRLDDDQDRGNALIGQGEVLTQLARFDEALGVAAGSETIFRRTGDDLGRAQSLLLRGQALGNLGRADDAVAAFAGAYALHKKSGSVEGQATARFQQANALLSLGRAEESLEYLVEVERLYRDLGAELQRAETLVHRGKALFALGRRDEGFGLFAIAEKLIAQQGTDTMAMAHFHASRAPYLLSTGETAAAVAAGARALELVDRLVDQNRSPALRSDLAERFSYAAQSLYASYMKERRVGDAVATVEARRSWILSALVTPSRATPAAPDDGSRWTLDAAEVRRMCDAATRDGAVVVAWYAPVFEQPLRCLVARRGRPPLLVETATTLDSLVSCLGNLLQDAESHDAEAWAAKLLALGDELWTVPVAGARSLEDEAAVVPPRLCDLLREAESDTAKEIPLVMIPQGLLHLVPFAALARRDEVGGVRYLLQDHLLTLAPSLKAARAADDETGPLPRRALVLGDPANELTALPWSGDEAERIASLLHSVDVEVDAYGRRRGLDPAAWRRLAPSFDLLHLATHAAFSTRAPFASYVALSTNGGGATNLLRLMDVLELDLAGATAVLSACTTASADWKRVFDPVSLSSAFLAAGCRRVIGSLWPVHDRSTGALMLETYRGALEQGLGWPAALRSAQLRLLDGTLDTGLPRETVALPYFWAAFQCHGAA